MVKSAMIRARIEPGLKTEVEIIFKDLGLSVSEAINLFYNQVRLRNGLPFEVRIPNETTLNTFEKTDAGNELNTYKSVSEFFEKLD